MLKHRKENDANSVQTKATVAAATDDVMRLGKPSSAADGNAAAASDVDALPLTPDRRWLNMSTIEYDKLEWTKSVSTPTTGDSKTGTTARFDFQVRQQQDWHHRQVRLSGTAAARLAPPPGSTFSGVVSYATFVRSGRCQS